MWTSDHDHIQRTPFSPPPKPTSVTLPLFKNIPQATAGACGGELLVTEETVIGVCGRRSAVATLPSSPTSVAPREVVVAAALSELLEFLPRLVALLDHKAE